MRNGRTWYLVLLSGVLAAHSVQANPLAEIARSVEGQARRASSGLFDPESNVDAWHIAPGQSAVLTELRGPGEIRHMWFTLFSRDRRYPRTAVLRIWWDGSQTPSVETPIGDFFAAGNGMTANVQTLPIEVTSYGRALNCYWRMPFRRSARIEIANEGPYDLGVYWQFDWMELPQAPADMLYFHARYRQEFPARPFSPYVIFEGQGRGHYVGTVFSTQCSYDSWFGESDDRFYIDGEEEPSIVGTGTEDFFNDAWNFRLFTNLNTGVTIKEPNGEDCRFTAYRWHIQAPVTFRESLKVEIERRSYCRVTDPETGRSQEYNFKYRPDFCSSVAYWYQDAPAATSDPFPPVKERVHAETVVEVAEMAGEIKTGPGVKAARRTNRVCHQKQMLYVTNEGPGGWFEIPCRVADEGKYSISLFQRLFRTQGIWKVTLCGPTGDILLARAMDFYDPYLAWKENRPENFIYGTRLETKVGIHHLKPGDYRVRLECVGAHILARKNDADTPGYDCGLDGISIRRFPWDDLPGQMRQYLADEEKLFAGWIDRARRTVTQLDAAIRKFVADTKEYPRNLDELTTRPDRFPESAGRWPYAERPGRDPWGQSYRYVHPGQFNPDGFDVFSVHGNSRSPADWIGNWTTPYRWEGAIEGEGLPLTSNSSVKATSQSLRMSAPPALSQGELAFLRFRRQGESAGLILPSSMQAGRYTLAVRLGTSWDYGIAQLHFNDVSVGAPIDTFSPRIANRTVFAGEVEVVPGQNTLTIQMIGRNPASTGYAAGLDALRLIPVK
ncbi:MAG TPA: DUF2961 domain-containing protein [Phycisphaerae bacterium]|nr:DUF2961 domain-containing protein [Phycisphaerae bacterium]HRY68123.1 DUF2961 domain-containing protein [Phycisphaerae bacterium]HSA28794.1 DUF2961 domain-containing protein [Phycisphaerae bacterium]